MNVKNNSITTLLVNKKSGPLKHGPCEICMKSNYNNEL